MTTIQPPRLATRTTTVDVRASALAAWQLVEDARYRTSTTDRRIHREHLRAVAGRAVADRRLARDLVARDLVARDLAARPSGVTEVLAS